MQSRIASLAIMRYARRRSPKAKCRKLPGSTSRAIRSSVAPSSVGWPSSKDQQGQRLGSILLADALQRAFESASTVGSSMVIVDALDEAAAGFYAAHGFMRLPDSLRLIMPMRQTGRRSE